MIGLWNRDQRAQPTHYKLRALHNANENLNTKRELKFSILNENIYLYICKLSLYLVIHISITKFAQILLPTNLRSFLYFPSSKIIKSEIFPTGNRHDNSVPSNYIKITSFCPALGHRTHIIHVKQIEIY